MARPKSNYTGKAVYEANAHGTLETIPVKRLNNRPDREQVKALFAAGVDVIESWGWANFPEDAALIEAAILRLECNHPEIDPATIRREVSANPEIWT